MTVGSFQNLMASQARNHAPEVGMGATEIMWTDRHAYTVVEVKTAKMIVVQEDKATRTDKNGMSDAQSYSFEADPTAPRVTLRLCKAGWQRRGGGRFYVGSRSEYHDYSF